MGKYFIYHHTDDDGYGAGAMIYRLLKNKHNIDPNDIISFAIGYNFPLPDVDTITKEDTVYYLDYSFSNPVTKNQFKELHERGIRQLWLDHHKSSEDFIEEIKMMNEREWNDKPFDLSNIYFDMRISGAMISYLYPSHTVNMSMEELSKMIGSAPIVIQYISDWDLFEFKIPNTKSFHYGFSLYEEKFNIGSDLWNRLFSKLYSFCTSGIDLIDQIISKGETIIEYNDIQTMLSLGNAYIIKIDDREVVTMNRAGNSTIFGEAYDIFGLVMPFSFDGTNWKYSIFSNQKDPNAEDFFSCNEFAKRYGGGGHPTAAGFSSKSFIDFEFVCRLYDHPKWHQHIAKIQSGK